MRPALLLLILNIVSCSTSTQKADSGENNEQKSDFEIFVSLFDTRLTKIPGNYINQFLQIDTTIFDAKDIWTYEAIQFSDEIIGLIYKANCTAGGFCEKLTLITFDKSGRRITEFEVGHHYADYGFSNELTYSIDQDQIKLRLYKTETFETEDGSYLEGVMADTTFVYRVDTATGQINNN